MPDSLLLLLQSASLALALQSPPSEREASVLKLLEGIQEASAKRYAGAVFESTLPPVGNEPVFVPVLYNVDCANSDSGTFDDVQARHLAAALCDIYGLQMIEAKKLVDGERSVVFDSLDPESKVGIKLRGRGNVTQFGEAAPETQETDLTESEFDWLAGQGYRLYTADVAQYRNFEDNFTPTLAFLAGLVYFLNRVTEGEDVDPGAAVFQYEAAWEYCPEPMDGIRILPREFGYEIVAEDNEELVLHCRGAADYRLPNRDPWGFEGPVKLIRSSTKGCPSAFVLNVEACDMNGGVISSEILMSVHQSVGNLSTRHEGRSSICFLPGVFDLALPFEVRLRLGVGRYRFYGPARIGAAGSRS